MEMIPKVINYCWFGRNPLPPLAMKLSLIHISEPTRQAEISYAVFCLKKKKKKTQNIKTKRTTETKRHKDQTS